MDGCSFYTFSEYMRKGGPLTASMEDYLEMIYRLSLSAGFTRVNELAQALNVQPPSATKMVQRLARQGLVKYERYGVIILGAQGRQRGQALLRRHEAITEFLTAVGVGGAEVFEQTEKIEHTVSALTVRRAEDFAAFIKANPDVAQRYGAFLRFRDAQGVR
jgi:Mn-dependent DtxR family transcriptional regulator